ncbi:lytic murein transglycosylase [Rhodopseudomonas pseudopalustris]|uniref:Lytic murein transglycosylase n=2 Tax=Rhodopseudomonas pseudopalustris TaxID=1513892 RepID=A0A1H8QIP7_9BRAD|nr:lytic murein transglycosylase [Rhodopseudomonas pseudopalustris]
MAGLIIEAAFTDFGSGASLRKMLLTPWPVMVRQLHIVILALVLCVAPGWWSGVAAAADPGFARFLAELWPQAREAGISRATFDAVTVGLEPDYKLPDLILPGRPKTGAPAQAEFVQVPADYLKEASIARLAAAGQKLFQQYQPTLRGIEQRFGVPATVVLAIWGRETDYGRYRLPYDAVRVMATQAYVGRRKDQYRTEFIMAMKIIDEGAVTRQGMRSSWAGATGLTQFLPSEYYKHGVDFDGDGKVDIWNSVPDALASAAQQLVNKGWKPSVRWAYEVRAPGNADCTRGVPELSQPIGQWLREGFTLARNDKLSASELAEPASLLQPEGIYGPAFLTTKNYFVIKEYNFSDLYVLFVGHLADRMTNPQPFATPWAATKQLRTADVEAMQRGLTRLGLYNDKIDGKAGMMTRSALGAYQKSARLKLDCWPSEAVLRSIEAAR